MVLSFMSVWFADVFVFLGVTFAVSVVGSTVMAVAVFRGAQLDEEFDEIENDKQDEKMALITRKFKKFLKKKK